MQKINFIPPIVFEILKFKNPAIWLAKSIFAINSRSRFSQTCSFNRIIKVIMVHDLNLTNLHMNGLFFQWQKNPIFGLFLGIIPNIRFFSKNPAPPVFDPGGTQITYCCNYWHMYKNLSKIISNDSKKRLWSKVE